MQWWLEQVPPDAGALVVENSAVAPPLQSFAPDLVSPSLVVWTTLRADHAEAWGPGLEGAASALMNGVPRGAPVVGGRGVPHVLAMLSANKNVLRMSDPPPQASHKEENLALAKTALDVISTMISPMISPPCLPDAGRAEEAMRALPPDVADFRVLTDGTDELAAAFSANDLESTALLFAETGWTPEETTLLYHHRHDRPARLKDFLPWIEAHPWKEKIFTRTRRSFSFFPLGCSSPRWNDGITTPASFQAWLKGRGRVFACGNVAGWPIEFLSTCGSVTDSGQ
jgi:hypothetical protein